MHVSVLLTSFPHDFTSSVGAAAEAGFSHIGVIAECDRPAAHLETLAETSLIVVCAALGRNLPAGLALDTAEVADRRVVLDVLKQQVADAARLGATCAYLVPGTEKSAEGLARFAEICGLLADFAAQRIVRLCVEHVPGRALDTAAGTLAWLNTVNHPNLGLLVDLGHCLITGEDPAKIVQQAGPRLGYVHLDDNDGLNDVHWPLLTGRLTEEMLRAFLNALRSVGYSGALALELKPGKADLTDALIQNKTLVERLLI